MQHFQERFIHRQIRQRRTIREYTNMYENNLKKCREISRIRNSHRRVSHLK